MIKNNHDVILASQTQPLHEKVIYWGTSPFGDHFKFPRELDIYNRGKSTEPMPLSVFVDAVKAAAERILIVDEYFFTSGSDDIKNTNHVQNIRDWFHKELIASDIRILTGSHDKVTKDDLNQVCRQAELINRTQPRRETTCTIAIKTNLSSTKFNYVHDRFAIVDNELWHFGGTVGGYMTKVSAVSRGWCAKETGAIDFFDLIWSRVGGKPHDVA
ncbi:MAG: hypothetical protein LBE93_18575 [Enterobacter asburiae]|jgi:hypothetical protein|nr:hypothetical protein [Enterobacter asburiae]